MFYPLVSVITPIYNAEKYLYQSISSVYSQTYKNIELIVILDNCTDNSEEIIKQFYNDCRVPLKIIKNNERKGCPESRVIGINNSYGEYILIQDADDISFLNRIEKQVKVFEQNPDLFCVGSFAEKIDEENNFLGIMDYPPENNEDIIKMILNECKNPILDPTVMYKKQDYIELGGYGLNKNIYTIPDFDLWLRALISEKKFYNIQEPLVQYRINSEGMTIKHKKEMIEQHMRVWRKFKREYK